jgi:hypothetical protein
MHCTLGSIKGHVIPPSKTRHLGLLHLDTHAREPMGLEFLPSLPPPPIEIMLPQAKQTLEIHNPFLDNSHTLASSSYVLKVPTGSI